MTNDKMLNLILKHQLSEIKGENYLTLEECQQVLSNEDIFSDTVYFNGLDTFCFDSIMNLRDHLQEEEEIEELEKFANELNETIKEREEIEKKEKELKYYFKNFITKNNTDNLNLGSFFISLDECKRTSLDKNLLADFLGMEKIKEFEKVTSYKKFNIKKIA